MLHIQKWFGLGMAVLALVAVSFVFQRLLDPERGCLHFGGIYSLNVGGEIVPNCEDVSRVLRPKLSNQTAEFVGRLNTLAALNPILPRARSVRIGIANQPFEIQSGVLRFNMDLARSPGHLERATLLAWVQTNWPEQDELAQEVMVDVLMAKTVGVMTASSLLKFPLMPLELRSYCESRLRADEHIEVCAKSNARDVDPNWSMRPLISAALNRYIDSLSAFDQLQFLKKMLDHQGPTREIAAQPADLRDWVKENIQSFASRWATDTPNLKKEFAAAELNGPVQFDLLVELTTPERNALVLESLQRWLRTAPGKRVMLVTNEEKMVLPEEAKVDWQGSDFDVKRHVLIACEWPENDRVLKVKSRFFYAVQSCDGNNLPVWRELIQSLSETVASHKDQF